MNLTMQVKQVLRFAVTIMITLGILAPESNGQTYERKYHGIRPELSGHLLGRFVVHSKRACGAECSKINCELMLYTNASRTCTLYDTYMSDLQVPLHGLYAKAGAVDMTNCPALSAPACGSIGTTGTLLGDTISYTCIPGCDMIGGNSVRTCGAGGIWSGSEPVCEVRWAQVSSRIISVANGGPHGDWGNKELCEFGTYAYGYSLKLEEEQYSDDDTALNGIALRCKSLEGTVSGATITSTTEQWGDWTTFGYCPNNHFMTGFILQVEGDQGSDDDTTANFVKIKCRDFGGSVPSYEVAIPPGYYVWGSYGAWSNECGPDEAICGIKTFVEAAIGGDDTALNDVLFYCCT